MVHISPDSNEHTGRYRFRDGDDDRDGDAHRAAKPDCHGFPHGDANAERVGHTVVHFDGNTDGNTAADRYTDFRSHPASRPDVLPQSELPGELL